MSERILVEVDSELADIFPAFLKKRKTELPDLWNALSRRDFNFLKDMGHRLKGSAGGYGLSHLGVLGAQIEISGKEKNAERIESTLKALECYLSKIDVVYVKAAG